MSNEMIFINLLAPDSQENRVEYTKGSINSLQIEFGFERKMVEFGVAFEQFEFDAAAEGSKDMIHLSYYGLEG